MSGSAISRLLRALGPLAAAPLVLGSCASVPAAPASMEPGVYSFFGEARGTHQYRNRVEPFTVPVNGTVTILQSGGALINTTHGSCQVAELRRSSRGVATGCDGISIVLGSGEGTARITLHQIREERAGCLEYHADAEGRPTTRCRTERWMERSRSVSVAVPLIINSAPSRS